MKSKLFLAISLLICLAGVCLGRINAESNSVNSHSRSLLTFENRWYYCGNVGFSFWNDYFYLGVYPMVGYKVTHQLSVGGKIGYSYISDDTYEPFPALNTSNYGGSIFSRYRIVPQLYVHAEFAYFSFEQISSFNFSENTYETDRLWVPFLLLGGGFSQNVGPNTWLFAEVLFDVLQDPNSPYADWDPFISFGVGVGF